MSSPIRKQRDYMLGLACPFCGNKAEWCSNRLLYGKEYGRSHMIWWCRPCDARVGCRNNTMMPLGTMADANLRGWRMRTHRAIDQLWIGGRMTRKEMYAKLSEALGHEVHVAWSDVEECERIIDAAKKL